MKPGEGETETEGDRKTDGAAEGETEQLGDTHHKITKIDLRYFIYNIKLSSLV